MANEKKFLDATGTSYLWGKILQQLSNKANASDVESIETRVNSLEAGTYDDTELRGIISSNTTAIGNEVERATAAETALDGRLNTVESNITTLNGSNTTTGSVAKSVKDAIDTEISRANGAYAAKSYESKVDTLVGTDTSKSARTIASEEVAKIVANADSSYDTLKEIADWIATDTTGTATQNSRITTNETDIANLQALHATGSHNGKSTVAEEVTAGINTLDLSNTYYGKSAGEANAAAIATINGNASTTGSTAKKIADAISALNLSSNYYSKTSGEADAAAIAALQALHATGKTVAQEVTAGINALNLSSNYYSKSAGETNATAIGQNTAAITAIKDGDTLDSFGDVEVALSAEASRADGAYDTKGAAAAIKGTSSDTSSSITVYGARKYADSLASNYATAAQGTKADNALPSSSSMTKSDIDTAIANPITTF